MNKRFVIYAILLVAVAAGGVVYSLSSSKNKTDQVNDALLAAVIRDVPAFSKEGSPVVQIDSVSRYEDKWHIVTLKSLRPVEAFVPVKMLLLSQDESNTVFEIILGPDTEFTDVDHDHNGGVDLSSYNIPDPVMAELERS